MTCSRKKKEGLILVLILLFSFTEQRFSERVGEGPRSTWDFGEQLCLLENPRGALKRSGCVDTAI